MNKVYILGLLLLAPFLAHTQDPPVTATTPPIDRNNLQIRPNSRDYLMVLKGNDHQRVLQNRKKALLLRRQAIVNRRMAMDRRRELVQKKMFRQQQVRQRMIRQRGTHR